MSVKIEDKLFLDRFQVDEEPHIRIIDKATCMDNMRGPALPLLLPRQCVQA